METNLLPFDKRSGKGSGGGGKTQRKGEDGIRKEKHVSIPAFFPVSSFFALGLFSFSDASGRRGCGGWMIQLNYSASTSLTNFEKESKKRLNAFSFPFSPSLLSSRELQAVLWGDNHTINVLRMPTDFSEHMHFVRQRGWVFDEVMTMQITV